MESNPDFDVVVHSKLKFLKNYFSGLSRKLDSAFFRKVVEKENKVLLSKNPSEKLIMDLSTLYKKAIERYSFEDKSKVNFYMDKLTRLLLLRRKIKDEKKTQWKAYFAKHKEAVLSLQTFLYNEKVKTIIGGMLSKFDEKEASYSEKVSGEIDIQKEKFKKRLKERGHKAESGKKQKQIAALSHVDNKYDEIVGVFLKQFHYAYLHSKIFVSPVDTCVDTMNEIYYHKIKKYYYYQEQIKQFQLLLSDEGDQGDHQESIKFLLDDLSKERKEYFNKMETFTQETYNKMIHKCLNWKIEDDIEVGQYENEILRNITINYFTKN